MDLPLNDPRPPNVADPTLTSWGSLEVLSGSTSLSLTGALETVADPDTSVQLHLEPDQPVVIGRAEGREVPYLDPAYRPTRVVPGTGQPVVRSDSEGKDAYVSRGHFTLKGSFRGLLLINGVPRKGGGIRPPTNWTCLYDRNDWRVMDPGEEFLIEHQQSAVLYLPNGTTVRISAA